jgi:hypothetical protein
MVERGRGVGVESEGEGVRRWSAGVVSRGWCESESEMTVGRAREEAARNARGAIVV